LVPSFQGDQLANVSFADNPAIMDTSITELFHFDNVTGQVSFNMAFPSNINYVGAGGAEFSPDGSKLYIAPLLLLPYWHFQMIQYDLSIGDPSGIVNSGVVLAEQLGPQYVVNSSDPIEAAPDGRIYFGNGEGPQYLTVIEHPDSAGTACGLNTMGLFLPGTSGPITLPHFCKRYHDSALSVGVREQDPSMEHIALWPVPVNDRLHVKVPGVGRLAILDALGREVRWFRTTGTGTQVMDTQGLAPGLYTLCFTANSGSRSASAFVKE
jgi:hypothetical protein